MDNLLSVHQTKATKQTKPKIKKPVKVVYISNPMKVKTSASEFRALVQELTGQDSDMSRHGTAKVSILSELNNAVPSHDESPRTANKEAATFDHVPPKVQANIARACSGSDLITSEGYASSNFFDMPQVMENIPAAGPYYSSELWC